MLIHFPIALFLAAVLFDCTGAMAERAKRWSQAAYFNLLLAAISTVPVVC